MEKIFAPFVFAYFIALIKFTLTLCLIFPPPTEKMKIASFFFNFEHFKYSEKIFSKPSSFVLAVSSLTLSEGA